MKRFVIFSGGMDSYTLLRVVHAKLHQAGDELTAISYHYGQRHSRELERAFTVCMKLGIKHQIIDLRSITRHLKGSALTDNVPVPHGHYEAESMKATVVPGRNTMMLSIALGIAQGAVAGMPISPAVDADPLAQVYYGAHSGDHHIYPDCRPEFVRGMQHVFEIASEGAVSLDAPFLLDNKISILMHGQSIGLTAADYLDTWTCYEGGERPCGKCGACQERAEAFAAMGWEDPTYTQPWDSSLLNAAAQHSANIRAQLIEGLDLIRPIPGIRPTRADRFYK